MKGGVYRMLTFHAPSEFMSLFFTAHSNKVGGSEKSFGRQKMLGTAKPASVIFFGTKGEDRNFFVSIYRNKFAVQKQRVSDGAMKNTHKGRQKTRKRAVRKVKQTIRFCKQNRIPISLPPVTGEKG